MAKFEKGEANLFAIYNVKEEDEPRTELWYCELKKDATFEEEQNEFTYDVYYPDKKFPDEVRPEHHLYKKDELFTVRAKVITKMKEEKNIEIISELSEEEIPFPQLDLTENFYNLLDKNHEKIINNDLITLPKKYKGSIYSILKNYKDIECKRDELATDVLDYVTKIFNCTLPLVLLYTQERKQYKDIEKDQAKTKTLDKIYGIEHFSRLLIKLPDLLSFNKNEQNKMKLFYEEIQKLVRYLDKQWVF